MPRRLAGLAAGFTGCALLASLVWAWAQAPQYLPFSSVCVATANGQSASLDPEQAGHAATITAIAVERGLPARAATIAVATAMQESKLRNINYGDRDSLGLFQQRPSQGWGTEAQVQDPDYATNAFFDHLVKIPDYRNASITVVAQKIQRSAYPQAYAQHETEARIIASTLSGYSPHGFSCRLNEPTPAPTQASSSGAAAKEFGALALAETGFAARPSDSGLTFTLSGAERARMGWHLAHWAVAHAQGHRVMEVRTDGWRWVRQEGLGWEQKIPDNSPARSGQGVVEVVLG